jgi:hypothetical protein
VMGFLKHFSTLRNGRPNEFALQLSKKIVSVKFRKFYLEEEYENFAKMFPNIKSLVLINVFKIDVFCRKLNIAEKEMI